MNIVSFFIVKHCKMACFCPLCVNHCERKSDTMIKRQKWPVLALVLSLLTLSPFIMLYVYAIACFGPSLLSMFPLCSLLTISILIIRARAQSMHAYMLLCLRRAMSRAHRSHAVPYGMTVTERRAIAEHGAVCEAVGEALRV